MLRGPRAFVLSSMWQPRSLFLRSEFIFWRAYSVIEDVGDAILIHTPANPYWRWGHAIVLKSIPKTEDITRWGNLYAERIAPHQVAPRRQILWDGPELDRTTVKAYNVAGFSEGVRSYFVLRSLSNTICHEITIRDLSAEDNAWNDVVRTHLEIFGGTANNPNFDAMTRQRMEQHRQHVATGGGHWLAAFIGNDFVGSLGIFHGDSHWRFQDVAIRSQYQRRGIGRALLMHACRAAKEQHNDPIVIATSDDNATRLYTRLGFERDSGSFMLRERQ